VIPREGAKAYDATGGRSTRTTEGVLARGKAPPLTRRRRTRSLAIRSAWGPRSDTRSAEGRDRGRQRRYREPGAARTARATGGAARRSPRSRLRQDLAAPRRFRRARARSGNAVERRSPKLEARRQARLHLDGSPGSGPAVPQTRPAGLRPEGDPARTSRHVERRARREAPPGIAQSAGARRGSRLQTSVRRIVPVRAGIEVPETASRSTRARDSSRRPASL